MIVLGIDPGTSCGWAVRWCDGSYHSGVWTLAIRPHEGAGMRWLRLARHLRDVLAVGDMVVLVAYEQVARHKGTTAAHVYGGIVGEIERIAEEKHLDYVGVPVGTWKKFATGKGNCSGETALRAAEARWPVPFATDDEAAARWIAEYAHATYAEAQDDGRYEED